jgi:uncharacterized protein (DUF2461 family)
MLTVDEDFIKQLRDKKFMPELDFNKPREWHPEKLQKFTDHLRKQLPAFDKGEASA